MARFLETLLIVIAVVLVPLPTMAAAIVDLTPGAQQQTPATQARAQGEPDGSARCAVRLPHRPGGAVSDAVREALIAESATSPIPRAERGAPAFISERLERPRLALLR